MHSGSLRAMAAAQDVLAPLIALVNRLREELDEEVLEAKQRKLALAEPLWRCCWASGKGRRHHHRSRVFQERGLGVARMRT
jgi:hypothetical protein